MSGFDAYLDGVCRRLQAGPDEAEEIREELQGHLAELAQFYASQGASAGSALTQALAQFGDPARVGDTLNLVHVGDAWWLRRLKGLAVGAVFGAVLSALLPVGGHLEFALSGFALPAALASSHVQVVLNAALAGGLIGACSARGNGVLIGWSLGAVLWLGEYLIHWMWRAQAGAAEPATAMLNLALLAPLLGGIFGAVVGATSRAVLAAAARIRLSVQ